MAFAPAQHLVKLKNYFHLLLLFDFALSLSLCLKYKFKLKGEV